MTSLKVSDSGVYRCEANNSYRRDIREMNLLVMGKTISKQFIRLINCSNLKSKLLEPPTIVSSGLPGGIEIGSDAKKYVGDTIALHCNSSGHPKPTTTWTLDGRTVQHGSLDSVELRDSAQILTVLNAAVDHSGNYTCTATNPAGSVSRTSSIHVSPCRPSFVVDQVPKCVYTVFLIEESNAFENTKAALPSLASQLDQSLLKNGIGVRSGNHFSVIGFGTKQKARIITVESQMIFMKNRVVSAIEQLQNDGLHPDGYDAIYTALEKLPLKSEKVRDCPIHLLFVTTEPKSYVTNISKRKLHRKICETRPVIINAVINIPLVVKSKHSEVFALGINWRGFPYLRQGERYNKLHTVQRTVVGLPSFGVCTAFRQYGILPLQTNGSLWDIYYSFSYSKRVSLFSAIVNETVTSLKGFKHCVDCQCQRDESGNLVKVCQTIKDSEICNCRMNNIPVCCRIK